MKRKLVTESILIVFGINATVISLFVLIEMFPVLASVLTFLALSAIMSVIVYGVLELYQEEKETNE